MVSTAESLIFEFQICCESHRGHTLLTPFLGTGPSGTGQVGQIFIDCAELFIAHSSDRPPRHFLAEFMAVGINAGAHRGDELLKLPSLDKIEIGPERPKLSGHATGQLGAMARTAILIRQDVLAIQQSGARRRRRDGADGYRLSLRQHAGAQHRDTQQVEMIRLDCRLAFRLPAGCGYRR